MKTILSLLNNKKGFTLIELIISLALLGLISMIFVSIFGTGIAVLKNADDMTKDSMESAGKLEVQVNQHNSMGTDKLVFKGNSDVTITGTEIEMTDSEGIPYKIFVPNEK